MEGERVVFLGKKRVWCETRESRLVNEKQRSLESTPTLPHHATQRSCFSPLLKRAFKNSSLNVFRKALERMSLGISFLSLFHFHSLDTLKGFFSMFFVHKIWWESFSFFHSFTDETKYIKTCLHDFQSEIWIVLSFNYTLVQNPDKLKQSCTCRKSEKSFYTASQNIYINFIWKLFFCYLLQLRSSFVSNAS